MSDPTDAQHVARVAAGMRAVASVGGVVHVNASDLRHAADLLESLSARLRDAEAERLPDGHVRIDGQVYEVEEAWTSVRPPNFGAPYRLPDAEAWSSAPLYRLVAVRSSGDTPAPTLRRCCNYESPSGLWCEEQVGHAGPHRALIGRADETVWPWRGDTPEQEDGDS